MAIAKRIPLEFTPTQHSSADEKTWFYKQFVRFVTDGFPQSLFTKRFYNRLSMCFGHIAHYNQSGFYETWFSTRQNQLRFLRHTTQWPCHGQPEFTYCDVERALQQWVASPIGLKIVTDLQRSISDEIESQERAMLAVLKGKYEGVP